MKHEILQMWAQNGGAIVNTSSILGLVGLPNGTGYVAAKHGVIGPPWSMPTTVSG